MPVLAFAAAVAGCSPAAAGGVVVVGPAAPPLPPVAPDVAMLSAEGAPFGLRRSALADQWFWLRTRAVDGDVPSGFERARAAMVDLRAALSADAEAWEEVEVSLGSARSGEELLDALRVLPAERVTGDARVSLRAPALAVARELRDTEALYRKGPYRAHAATIDAAARDLLRVLGAREGELAQAIRAEMRAGQDLPSVVLTLVADAPYAGAFAADERGRSAAVFVRVRGLEGGALLETALAEWLHAVDELTVRDTGSAMNVLREALARGGMGSDDANVEMVVNTVTYAEAASLVRRFGDPSHRPLGESGFYELYPPAKAIVAAWDRHLAGEPLETTAEAIARAVASP